MKIKKINKNEYFIEENGVKVFSYILTDDILCAGSSDVLPNEELFIKILSFLKENMIIRVVNENLFSLFDKYCKVTAVCVERTLNYYENNYDIKEKYFEIDNLKIKYFETENSAYCNFIKNEISGELEISKVMNYLKNKNKLTFIIDVQNLDYFFSLSFKIEYKDYKLA